MKEAYTLRWSAFRRICSFALLSPIALLATPFLLGPVSLFLFHSLIPLYPIALVIMSAAGYFIWRYITWPCPRCGEPFGRFRDECQNCFLPKWADEDDLTRGEI